MIDLTNSGSPSRRPLAAAAVAAALVIGGTAYLLLRADDGDSGAKVPLVTLPEAAAPAPPSPPTPSEAARTQGTAPTEEMRNALGLREGAVVREVKLLSPKLGIRCGEVSTDGGISFKRFFHIESMTTGRVDDGSEDFRQHAANVCTARS